MDTSAADRLANLFASTPLPSRPEPGCPTLAERELATMTERNAKWDIPQTAQYPRKVHGVQPKPAAGGDLYTSSEDDDDYTASFQRKPKMVPDPVKKKSYKQDPRKMPEPLAFGYNSSQVPKKGKIAYAEDSLLEGDATEHHADLSVNPKLGLPATDGESHPATGKFCQFGLLAKFPYKYMVDENSRISRHFFANQKFYERTWDLYYLHAPESLYLSRPLLLLPYHQVQALIEEISIVFKAQVKVPPFPFTIRFCDDGTPQPVFHGTTMSRADINDLQDSIPEPPRGHGEPPRNSTPAIDHSFAAFKAKVERAHAAEKRKKAAIKKKKANDRFLNIQDWCKQLRRAQRYFGIRPEPSQVQVPPAGLSWDEQDIFMKAQEKSSGVTLDPLDVGKPAPHDFHKAPIIISIDIESYERQHDIITEVGVSTLDTLDLVDIPLGEGGEEWMQQIRSRHFRIKGRENYVNKDFCIGDGNAFQFGDSEWVDLEHVGDVIDSCFEYPFSVQYKHDGKLKFHSGSWEEAVDKAKDEAAQGQEQTSDASGMVSKTNGYGSDTVHIDSASSGSFSSSMSDAVTVQKGPRERTILLTGHDLSGDLAYLSKLKSAIFSRPREAATQYPPPVEYVDVSDPRAVRGAKLLSNIQEALDTGVLYKVLLKEQNTRSLTSIMADIGRSAFYSHNGGNDARYTLEALIGLVVKSRLLDDDAEAARQKDLEVTTASQWESEKVRRISDKVAAAKAEVEEEMEAWEKAGAAGTSPPESPKSEHSEFDAGAAQADTEEKHVVDDTWNFTPFTKTLEATHAAQDKKKKSAETKRREYEMRVRQEDGIEGPCDWAVGGKDGVGK